MPYASKELIERAVELDGMTISNEIDHDEWKDARDGLIKDLAKATPLPTDAEHEAAIEAWRKEALTWSHDTEHVRGHVISTEALDAICDLARRAPRPGPKPIDEGDASRLMALIDAALASGSPVTEIASDHDGTPCRLVLASGVGIKLVDSWVRGLLGEPATEPKPEPQPLGNPLELPEPRASSALLEAAKAVLVELDRLRRGQRPQRVPMFVHADTHTELRQAIEAEEARGPSEIEQLSQSERQSLVDLRARLDEVVKELSAAKNDRDEWRAMADPAVCRRQFPDGSVPGNAEECAIGWLNLYEGSRKEVEQLRKERDEAREQLEQFKERAEKAEASAEAHADGDNPTLMAVCETLGADVDSVEAASAMMVERSERLRLLEIAALDAAGWLRARLRSKRSNLNSQVRDAIEGVVERIWSIVGEDAKGRWPCHPPGIESSVEPVEVDDALAVSTPPQPNHTSDDRRLTAFTFDWFAVHHLPPSARRVKAIAAEEARAPSEPVSDPYRLDEETQHMLLVEQLCKERDEARAASDAKLRQFADWIRSHGDCTEEEALTEIDRLLANLPANTPPQPNHTSDDRRLTAFLREYGSYKPGTLARLDEAALAELCRRALGGK